MGDSAMKIGLIDVDSHNFPNLALMKLSAWHKAQGDAVEWWWGFGEYDRVYMLNALSMRCGFGKNYYKFDSGSIATATEVLSGNQDLQSAVHKHGIILKSAMEELARIILRTGNSIMGKSLNEDVNIKVELDDSIFVDREKVLEDMRIDVQAGVLKPEIYIAEKYSVSVKKAKEMMPGMEDLTDEDQDEIGAPNSVVDNKGIASAIKKAIQILAKAIGLNLSSKSGGQDMTDEQDEVE